MTDFLLELLSEEIPARMQDRARADLARLFAEEIGKAGLAAAAIETYATPRRLALIARGLPPATEPVREETKGPRASAPPQALEGFLRKTGLAREALVERDGVLFAVVERPGRATTQVLAEAVPAIVRAFPWPKSMRWGEASAETTSLRWVRPLHGIVALFGDDVVACEVEGVRSGALTVGHRFHHPGGVTIGNADDYAAKLRACHVIVDQAERAGIIRDGAAALAAGAGLALVPDEGLVAENAGLTEWPVPLLGSFDPAFLDVPREVIQLTMRTNQKYFACVDGAGRLAPNFICTANIAPQDDGAAIAAGNARVLAARLADARFFWEQDLKVPLADQAAKLDRIVFHEKLGTVADKVERVAKLARWLVEEGIVKSSPSLLGEGDHAQHGGGARSGAEGAPGPSTTGFAGGPPPRDKLGEELTLAALAERAARLCKADLVTAMVGEFPELQGVIGGHLARAQGEPDEVADAIRDHYKPVGQGDEVPTAPVTLAVGLADKLDTISNFFAIDEAPTGSKDPFALRRSALGAIALIKQNCVRVDLVFAVMHAAGEGIIARAMHPTSHAISNAIKAVGNAFNARTGPPVLDALQRAAEEQARPTDDETLRRFKLLAETIANVRDFFLDRLEVAERGTGVGVGIIRAAQIIDGDRAKESDLVRLLARVKALQAFVATEDGANLLAGYRRAANIVRIEWKKDEAAPSPPRGEGWGEGSEAEPSSSTFDVARALSQPSPRGGEGLSYVLEPAEAALIAALDAAEPAAAAAVAREDFEGAMQALARLRPAVDAFFDHVTVNDPDTAKRASRLALLDRIRAAVHNVADFSRIEG